jgi:hypothetical protein
MQPLALAESGVCKRQEENLERGINRGGPEGVPVYAAKVRILLLTRAEGLAPKQGRVCGP